MENNSSQVHNTKCLSLVFCVQGQNCSRCTFTHRCFGCPVSEDLEVIFLPGDQLTVTFIDPHESIIEILSSYTDHKSMAEQRSKQPLHLHDCFRAFSERYAQQLQMFVSNMRWLGCQIHRAILAINKYDDLCSVRSISVRMCDHALSPGIVLDNSHTSKFEPVLPAAVLLNSKFKDSEKRQLYCCTHSSICGTVVLWVNFLIHHLHSNKTHGIMTLILCSELYLHIPWAFVCYSITFSRASLGTGTWAPCPDSI